MPRVAGPSRWPGPSEQWFIRRSCKAAGRRRTIAVMNTRSRSGGLLGMALTLFMATGGSAYAQHAGGAHGGFGGGFHSGGFRGGVAVGGYRGGYGWRGGYRGGYYGLARRVLRWLLRRLALLLRCPGVTACSSARCRTLIPPTGGTACRTTTPTATTTSGTRPPTPTRPSRPRRRSRRRNAGHGHCAAADRAVCLSAIQPVGAAAGA